MQLSYNIFLNFQPVFQRDHHNKLLQSLLLPCPDLAVMEITIKQIDAKSLAKTIMDSYHKFFKTRKIKKNLNSSLSLMASSFHILLAWVFYCIVKVNVQIYMYS